MPDDRVPERKLAKDGSRRGGARPGSGPKAKPGLKRIGDHAATTEEVVGPMLPSVYANLKLLADGGFPVIVETFERPDGIRIEFDNDRGAIVPPGDGLILVKRVVSIAPPDRGANDLLASRLLGKCKDRVEASGVDGGAVLLKFEREVEAAYGEKPDTESEATDV